MKNFDGAPRTLALLTCAFCLGSFDVPQVNPLFSPAVADTAPHPVKPSMTLTEKNDGKTVTTRVGDIIEVRLISNATTGYEWSVVQHNKYALESVGKPSFIAPTNGLAGASGQQVFQFKTLKAGMTQLKLGYARSFETGKPPIQTFDVKIKIK